VAFDTIYSQHVKASINKPRFNTMCRLACNSLYFIAASNTTALSHRGPALDGTSLTAAQLRTAIKETHFTWDHACYFIMSVSSESWDIVIPSSPIILLFISVNCFLWKWCFVKFQTFAVVWYIEFVLFWVITRRFCVVRNRRFRTDCFSHLQGTLMWLRTDVSGPTVRPIFTEPWCG
jgi:hypothetical protein